MDDKRLRYATPLCHWSHLSVTHGEAGLSDSNEITRIRAKHCAGIHTMLNEQISGSKS